MDLWTAADIEIALDAEHCEGALVTVRIRTPSGDLEIIGEIEQFDRELVISGIHI